MKKLALMLTLVLGATGAFAQTDADLRADGTKAGSTDNVLTYGMGYHQNRYSPLNQINKSTVKKLVPVWSTSLDNELGEQAQPLIRDGVMYVANARWTYAIDALTGKVIWRSPWSPGRTATSAQTGTVRQSPTRCPPGTMYLPNSTV